MLGDPPGGGWRRRHGADQPLTWFSGHSVLAIACTRNPSPARVVAISLALLAWSGTTSVLDGQRYFETPVMPYTGGMASYRERIAADRYPGSHQVPGTGAGRVPPAFGGCGPDRHVGRISVVPPFRGNHRCPRGRAAKSQFLLLGVYWRAHGADHPPQHSALDPQSSAPGAEPAPPGRVLTRPASSMPRAASVQAAGVVRRRRRRR